MNRKHEKDENDFHSGYVSIIGKPNVGKSTLLNAILCEKIAIVTPKPQTTRNKIVGIKSYPNAQIIFLDTPGIHNPRHRLGETMVKTAVESLREVDIILFMIEPADLKKDDARIIELLRKATVPVFLLINKIDTVKKSRILELIDHLNNIFNFSEIIPISALKNDGVDLVVNKICEYLPVGPKYYPDDSITDQLERFMVSEIIREKIMNMTEEELPYSVAIEISKWEERDDGLVAISCNIYVERDGQKAIIIGKRGAMLKSIGSAARLDIEKLLNTRVFLEMWVKVKKNWRNDSQLLNELGYR